MMYATGLQAPVSPYAWQWEHFFVPALIAVAYLACIGPLRARFADAAPVSRARSQLFLLGVLTLFVATVSPLDTLSNYLLTAHMIQHLLMTLIVPPLLLLGTPAWLLRPLL